MCQSPQQMTLPQLTGMLKSIACFCPNPITQLNQDRKKKNSNHRLLTSPEIIKEKMEAAEMKSKREAEKSTENVFDCHSSAVGR